MRKKILIGSMLVLTLLLFMPSIPAIQQKIIEDKVIDDFVKKPDDEDIMKILKIRYAKGEITKEEFEQMKKDLE